jgi:hypothetical protein
MPNKLYPFDAINRLRKSSRTTCSISWVAESVLELERHGLQQENCAASYVGRIMGKEYFIYRVKFNSMLSTLGVRINIDGRTSIDELTEFRNSDAGKNTLEQVKRWHEENTGS